MQVPPRLYVAASSQHVGKTTTTLGLFASLQALGLDTGYCKPVGQKFIEYQGERVDKDAHLFASFFDFELQKPFHSPVVLGPGVVARHLDGAPTDSLEQRVMAADEELQNRHDTVVYEGTGHPGVGSAIGMSNADVAATLAAEVVMVVEAGIGKTLDQFALNASLFRARGVGIAGVVVNKARPDKLEKIRHYVGRDLQRQGIPLLGIVPYEARLGLPQVQTLQQEIGAECWLHRDELHRPFHDLLSSHSLEQVHKHPLKEWLLVVGDRQVSRCLNHFQEMAQQAPAAPSPLAGILVAGDEPCLTRENLKYLHQHRTPVLITSMDTYAVVLNYGNLKVKMNARTPWKMKQAISLFRQHVDLQPLLEKVRR